MAESRTRQVSELLQQGNALGTRAAQGKGNGDAPGKEPGAAPRGGMRVPRGERNQLPIKELLDEGAEYGDDTDSTGGDDDTAGEGLEKRAKKGDPDSGDDDARAEEGGDSEGGDAAGDDEEKPVTLRELAEELGVNTRDVLDVNVYMGLADPADKKSAPVYKTIGELREVAQEFERERAERGEITEMRGAAEFERAEAARELFALAAMIEQSTGRAITPQMMEQAKRSNAARLQREGAMLNSALPQWKDQKTRDADLDVIGRYAKRFGFADQEIAGVGDHRIVMMLRDAAQRWDSVKQAAGKALKPKLGKEPKQQIGSAQQTRSASLRAKLNKAKSGSKQDKIAAVSALISQ